MKLDYIKEIDDLLRTNRLYEIAKQLDYLQYEKTELISEALSISEEIGIRFTQDDFDIYDLKDAEIGFYKNLVPVRYIKAIYKKDMVRISFNLNAKDFTERQIDFIKEIIFSAIMLARIMKVPDVDFQHEWVVDEYINGFCFSSDESVRSIYEKLQRKDVIAFCGGKRFLIEDNFFDFLEIPE
jgi:hypothetical protein